MAKDKEQKKRKNTEEEKKSKKPKSSSTAEVSGNEWMESNRISVKDSNGAEWAPVLSFDDTALSKKVLYATKNFDKPTPIQSICWPILLKNRDIIAIAETGSGKTLGFGLPAISKLYAASKSDDDQKKRKKPTVLVLSPTRELASQTNEQMLLACKKIGATSTVIFGGVSKDDQRRSINAGTEILVACPGRLIDLVEDGSCSLSSINYVVLDEADRLLDLGFEKEIKKIISLTRKDRQTAMFSATWPTSVQKLAQEYLNAPVKVTVGSKDLGANNNITQIVEVVEPKDKDWKLTQLLNKYHASRRNKIVLFALYKKEAARLEKNLSSAGWNCVAIHGDMSQDQRTRSFEKFRSGEIPLLIATDVAARGLDIPSVEYVINYTFPLTTEDYVHRIGRTGRAGEKGTAHTFFTSFDKARAGELINVLKQAKQEVPESLMSFGTTVKKKEHSAYGAFFKDVDPNQKGTKITFGSDDEQ